MTDRDALFIGLLLNSALYLACCFIAGLVEHNFVAWRLAVAAMGFTYLAYMIQFRECDRVQPHALGVAMVGLSIFLGAAAGLALLF